MNSGDPTKILIEKNRSVLIIVDVQEKLVPAVAEPERVVANASRLVSAAQRLDVPVLMTEHCSSRIGPLVPELRKKVPGEAILQKAHFAMLAEESCAATLERLERRQCVLAGTETHVCVMQSALSLKQAGYQVFVVGDAVSSRNDEDRRTALERLRDDGIRVVTTEMVIFEWLERGDTPEFRELLPVIQG